jgi:hypothetical protein
MVSREWESRWTWRRISRRRRRLRAGFGLLKSAGAVPPEVEAMRVVAWLRERIAAAKSEEGRKELCAELMARETELVMGLERMKLSMKADAVG